MSDQDVTALLDAWSRGDEASREELFQRLYGELRRLAHGAMRRERPDHTLQTTAIVHEAYLKLVDQRQPSFRDREHFLAFAAQLVRRLLVEHARRHLARKRGANVKAVVDDLDRLMPAARAAEYVALDDALRDLRKRDPRQADIVELHFFAGLSIRETAEVVRISPATVKRDLSVAKGWLYAELHPAA